MRCNQCIAVVQRYHDPLPVIEPPDQCVPATCEGCGPTFVNKHGDCIWPSCPVHGHGSRGSVIEIHVDGKQPELKWPHV